MPWMECNKLDEKLKFVSRLLEGEKLAPLCREFNISRKTGYKIWSRYKDFGLEGLEERSRKPHRTANQLPFQIEQSILRIKQEKPNWGAPKLREILSRRYPDIKLPAKSTVHAVLSNHGLVKKRRAKRYKAEGTPLSHPVQPNQLWCADYKGEFMLGCKQYCYPLTITDFSSRFLLSCESLEATK